MLRWPSERQPKSRSTQSLGGRPLAYDWRGDASDGAAGTCSTSSQPWCSSFAHDARCRRRRHGHLRRPASARLTVDSVQQCWPCIAGPCIWVSTCAKSCLAAAEKLHNHARGPLLCGFSATLCTGAQVPRSTDWVCLWPFGALHDTADECRTRRRSWKKHTARDRRPVCLLRSRVKVCSRGMSLLDRCLCKSL